MLVIGEDAGHVYLTADVDADSDIAIDGVSVLKALWSSQSESD